MTLIEKARILRGYIEKAMTATTSLTDAEALDAVCMFPKWSGDGVKYVKGQRVQDEGVLYTILQDHISQSTWKPKDAPSLFAKVLIPDPTVIYEWEQPDSTNPYPKDAKVKHLGKIWQSDYDNNVWEPGVFGWHEVDE